MVLTNNWIALLWVGAGGMAMHHFLPKERLGKTVASRWTMWAAIALVIPLILWAGFRIDTGDTGIYRRKFLEAPSSLAAIPSYLEEHNKDRGFSVLMILMKKVIGDADVLFFLLIAMFQMVCLAVVYRRYSPDFCFSIFLFLVSTDYFSWLFNGMRQFIAVAGVFACTGLMLKRKYVPLILVILFLSTIHGSALIMLPIVFVCMGKAWNRRTILLILATVVIITFVEEFTDILDTLMAQTQYSDILSNEIWLNDDGTNILRVLVYSVPAFLALVGRGYIRQANDPVVNLSVNMSICAAAFYFLSSYTSGIYVGRIPIYMSLYSYISLPWLLRNIFTRDSTRLMYGACIGAYLVFFYIQMYMAWA